MSASAPSAPRIAVLMATYNGVWWVREQLVSVCKQSDVEVNVVVSDDGSTDGTLNVLLEHVHARALALLPDCPRMGNANRNFLRLICEAPLADADFVAFADQDDVWFDDKLSRAVRVITRQQLDAYSSDVVAVWPDGRRKRLKKGGALRDFDYLFEAAGPGCTYVLRRSAFEELRTFARHNRDALSQLKVHDWWIYAFGRVRSWSWFIDPHGSMLYRQHTNNEVGANVGWTAAWRRWQNGLDGHFRRDALAIADAVGDTSLVTRCLTRDTWSDRLLLATMAPRCRRRPRDALVLALILLIGRRSDVG